MKFLIDRCAGQVLANWLRTHGHDVVETRERVPDPGDEAILDWAENERRVLVTTDKDFGALLFLHRKAHCGIVRLPHVPHIDRIALMESVLSGHGNDLESGAIVTVRGGRIRVSRAPAASDGESPPAEES